MSLPFFNQVIIFIVAALVTAASSHGTHHTTTASSHHISQHKTISTQVTPSIVSPAPTAIATNSFSSDYSTNTGHDSPTLSKEEDIQVTQTPISLAPRAHPITITTSIHTYGKTIHLRLTYPSDGGAVSGVISGDCDGTIDGNFIATTQHLQGIADGNCHQGIITIPVSISYSGTIDSSQKATIHYIASALGKKEEGNTTLSVNN